MASAVFVGIATVFQAERDQVDGMVLGLSSAALAALFSTFNGVLVKRLDPVNLSAVELLSASAAMLVWLAWRGQAGPELFIMSAQDWVWVTVLAVVATSFAFVVSIQVLKNLTPFESAMAINLEPLYAIVLACGCLGAVQPRVLPRGGRRVGRGFFGFVVARPDSIHGEQRRRDLIASDPIGFWNAKPSGLVFHESSAVQRLGPRFCIHVLRTDPRGAMQLFRRDASGCAQAGHHQLVVTVPG